MKSLLEVLVKQNIKSNNDFEDSEITIDFMKVIKKLLSNKILDCKRKSKYMAHPVIKIDPNGNGGHFLQIWRDHMQRGNQQYDDNVDICDIFVIHAQNQINSRGNVILSIYINEENKSQNEQKIYDLSKECGSIKTYQGGLKGDLNIQFEKIENLIKFINSLETLI